MADKTFFEFFTEYIKANQDKCPGLLLPRIRHFPEEPPFPSGEYQIEYERLNLKVFLNCLYPNGELHTTLFTADSIFNDLKNAYSDFTFHPTPYFFRLRGSEVNVFFLEMIYYQDEIDLRGRHPLNGEIDEPVLVVQYESEKVLYNGYHRASFKMLLGNSNILAYVLKV